MVISAKYFIEKLQAMDLSYRYRNDVDKKTGQERTSVFFAYRGHTVTILFDPDGRHVGLQTVFEQCRRERIPVLLEVCNTLNKNNRWLKFYVDDDDCLTVTDDAIVDPDTADAECFELLANVYSILEKEKALIYGALNG